MARRPSARSGAPADPGARSRIRLDEGAIAVVDEVTHLQLLEAVREAMGAVKL